MKIGFWKTVNIALARQRWENDKTQHRFLLLSFFTLMFPCISINLPFGYAWNTVFMPGLVLLVPTWISFKNKYEGLLILALLPLSNAWYYRNAASLSLLYRYYFGGCSSKLAELVPLLYSRGKSTCYSDRLHNFSVTILRCYKKVYVNNFFLFTDKHWNSLQNTFLWLMI